MDFISEFIQDCELRQLTRRTIETYKSDIMRFLEFNSDPLSVQQKDLKRYLRTLERAHLADSTLVSRFSAINGFYEFLIYEGYTTYNPIPQFRKRYLPRHIHGEQRQIISIEDIRQLMRVCDNVKDAAIVAILAKTGIRRGELLNMTPESLDFQRQIIHVPEAAKRSNRILFMDTELKFILEEYLFWWEEHFKSNWLWITKKGGRIHKDYTGQMLAAHG